MGVRSRAGHTAHPGSYNKCCLVAASLEGYRKIAGGLHRATLLETEQAWLAAVKLDLMVL